MSALQQNSNKSIRDAIYAITMLAKQANPNAIPTEDFRIGIKERPRFIAPEQNEDETDEQYQSRIELALEQYQNDNLLQHEIVFWNEKKLGPKPTEEQINQYILENPIENILQSQEDESVIPEESDET